MSGSRQPWWLRRSDSELLLLAGVHAPPSESEGLARFAVLTTAAAPPVAELHDRMPVVVEPSDVERWLFAPPAVAHELLETAASPELTGVPVSTWVNDVAHDDPRCIEAVPNRVDKASCCRRPHSESPSQLG